MASSIDRAARGGRLLALAAAQHGVVARRQLLGLGFGRHAIRHLLETGRLHRVDDGVYAVGRPQLTKEGRWMAVVLACGPDAMLSHGSAAALWGIGDEWRQIEVAVRVASPRRRSGVRVRRRPTLAGRHVIRRQGIPVTDLVQTLVDFAAVRADAAVDRAVNEADRLDLIDPPTLRTALEVHRGEPGVRSLRALLDRRTFRLTRSDLERRFVLLCSDAGLPLPLTQQVVNGFEVDFYWPDLGLVVETDGLRYHRTPAEQARDRRRDQAHAAAGMTQLRFTHDQVRNEPQQVLATLSPVARRLLAAPVSRVGT